MVLKEAATTMAWYMDWHRRSQPPWQGNEWRWKLHERRSSLLDSTHLIQETARYRFRIPSDVLLVAGSVRRRTCVEEEIRWKVVVTNI
jgi:hypothetical protein